ncbi:MAG TPA: hypothetical protein VFM58_01250 [Solirubrobacteraceae bacterium]|nr:hypothetical protein [Solirubrobacteraceae bacterium]
MAWMDEILEARAEPIAQAVLPLVLNGPRWRHRRVISIAPLSGTIVRRRVSVDFTVPRQFHDRLRLPVEVDETGAEDQWVVPLGWLARRPLVSFDLKDAEERSMPRMLAAQTSRITRDMLLLAAAEGGLREGEAERGTQVADLAIAASAFDTGRAPSELVARARALDLGADFTSLVELSARGFLLLAVLPGLAGRRVVKWQTDEFRRPVRPSFEPLYLDLQIQGINEAASTHVEMDLPQTLQAASFRLIDRRVLPDPRADGHSRVKIVPLPQGERQPSTSEEHPRLMLGPVADAVDPHVGTDMLIRPGDFVGPALVLIALAALIVAVGLGSGIHDLEPAERSTAPSVLLGAFSVGFGLFLRAEDNAFVRALLQPSRAALGATAAALALAAIPLALRLGRGWVLGAWIAAACVIAIAGFVVLATIMNLTKAGRRLR